MSSTVYSHGSHPGCHTTARVAVGLQKLNTTTLLRAAAVVRNRCHVRDGSDTDTQCTQGANRRFTARAGSLDFDVQVLDTLFDRSTTSHFRSNLSCKRSRLARTLEALATRRSPRQSIALTVGDGDDRVVERSVHVRNTVRNVLANFLTNTCCSVVLCLCHSDLSIPYFFRPAAPLRGPLRVRALVRVR